MPDLLTLREHTERAGDVLDVGSHRTRLIASLATSEVCVVRRHDRLARYAMFGPHRNEDRGDPRPTVHVVTGFGIHPDFRSAPVIFGLCRALLDRLRARDVRVVRRDVYKTNALSMAFHRKLGFQITRENEKGVESTAFVADVVASSAIERMATRLARRSTSS